MLKIYIQIFGTIALVAIILINYNIFYRTPALEEIDAKQAQLDKVTGENDLMRTILAHESKFKQVEAKIDEDRETIRMELPTSFSPPDRTKRIYDLILACSLESTGIPMSAPLIGKPDVIKITDVVATPTDKDKFQKSIDSFRLAMDQIDPKMQQFLEAPSPMDRWAFYDEISKGLPGSDKIKLGAGFERHRYRLNLSGTYPNVKRFLWLVANDKPLLQATSVRIVPKAGLGETRLFGLDVVVIAYADRNTLFEKLNQDPSALLAAPKPKAAAPAGDAAAAKPGDEAAKPAEAPAK